MVLAAVLCGCYAEDLAAISHREKKTRRLLPKGCFVRVDLNEVEFLDLIEVIQSQIQDRDDWREKKLGAGMLLAVAGSYDESLIHPETMDEGAV